MGQASAWAAFLAIPSACALGFYPPLLNPHPQAWETFTFFIGSNLFIISFSANCTVSLSGLLHTMETVSVLHAGGAGGSGNIVSMGVVGHARVTEA